MLWYPTYTYRTYSMDRGSWTMGRGPYLVCIYFKPLAEAMSSVLPLTK